MISIKLSQQIFDNFINGRVINQILFDENFLPAPNPEYTEIFNHLDAYRTLYLQIGYELVQLEGCFFIRSYKDEQSHLDAAAKIQALLVVIGRAVTTLGYELEMLFDPQGGLTPNLAASIDQNEDHRLLLHAVKIRGELWEEACRILLDRRIATLNNKGNLVLLNAGQAMYRALLEEE